MKGCRICPAAIFPWIFKKKAKRKKEEEGQKSSLAIVTRWRRRSAGRRRESQSVRLQPEWVLLMYLSHSSRATSLTTSNKLCFTLTIYLLLTNNIVNVKLDCMPFNFAKSHRVVGTHQYVQTGTVRCLRFHPVLNKLRLLSDHNFTVLPGAYRTLYPEPMTKRPLHSLLWENSPPPANPSHPLLSKSLKCLSPSEWMSGGPLCLSQFFLQLS